jgi:hypothetical protein
MAKVNKDDYVSWTTEKGRYAGQVASVLTSGRHQVAIYEGTETVDATLQEPVARVRVLINNEDGTFSRSDRTIKIQTTMLHLTKEPEIKQVSAQVRETLTNKAKEHNESVEAQSKKTTTRTLIAVFERGIGAYQSNPESVRPTVTSAEQWAYARVNSFLYALRNGRFRRGKHDTDLLPKGHPQSTKSTDDIHEKRTDFPKRGDDQKVSIANSRWKVFPRGEAEKLRTEWPQIWRRGGNVLGNTQYRRLTKVMEQGGSPKTATDEKAIRLREAWVARHFKDFRLAGVVAQIKWLAVGSRGLSFMRKVISDEKKRLRDREKSLDEEE